MEGLADRGEAEATAMTLVPGGVEGCVGFGRWKWRCQRRRRASEGGEEGPGPRRTDGGREAVGWGVGIFAVPAAVCRACRGLRQRITAVPPSSGPARQSSRPREMMDGPVPTPAPDR